mmetsp:Transcript_21852/g.62272  ORF Transcript_21852/g.62272 Transcript_21852/m.62272 type:complete len:182 (-) Transcript_21852:117-662(-)|eukprot:CAMPEP_0119563638 /NCGR_PEP_ID=MMETSP1352-20130426/24139_1 /TAXON_ID=265584 /ORGANISM="Stauroneis constricta, Strain CCMP1120" /LENGTH=181 /DNA_ID=CAMNT_0007612275 /DNA_START=621 /DNA_END=1166 /DNA_ORIENTATION=-
MTFLNTAAILAVMAMSSSFAVSAADEQQQGALTFGDGARKLKGKDPRVSDANMRMAKKGGAPPGPAKTLPEIVTLIDDGKCDLIEDLPIITNDFEQADDIFGECGAHDGTFVASGPFDGSDVRPPVTISGCCPSALIDFDALSTGGCTIADSNTPTDTDATFVGKLNPEQFVDCITTPRSG